MLVRNKIVEEETQDTENYGYHWIFCCTSERTNWRSDLWYLYFKSLLAHFLVDASHTRTSPKFLNHHHVDHAITVYQVELVPAAEKKVAEKTVFTMYKEKMANNFSFAQHLDDLCIIYQKTYRYIVQQIKYKSVYMCVI